MLAILGAQPLIDAYAPEEGGKAHPQPDYPEEGALRAGHTSRRWLFQNRGRPGRSGISLRSREKLEQLYDHKPGRPNRRLLPHQNAPAIPGRGLLTHLPGAQMYGTTTARGPAANAVRVPIAAAEPGVVPVV